MPKSAPTRAQRKDVTTRAFLFADLRGYTDFVERHGDAAAARLLRDYRALVRREVARHAGAEVKTEGDSFYVVFDSPSAAVDCAVAIQRRAAQHNDREIDARLSIGMGLHAGETVAFDKQFVGSAVNIRPARRPGRRRRDRRERHAPRAHPDQRHLQAPRSRRARTQGRIRACPRVDGPVGWRHAAKRVRASPRGSTHAERTRAGTDRLPGGHRPRSRTCSRGGAARRRSPGPRSHADRRGRRRRREERIRARGRRRRDRARVPSALWCDSRGRRRIAHAPFLAAVRSGFRGLDRDNLGRVLTQAAPDLAELFPELRRAQRAGDAAADQHRKGLAYARRHGVERAGIAYLMSVLAGVQFFTGDWDAALATAELIDEGTAVRFWTALYFAHAALARRGPEDVGRELAELARMLATRTGLADVQPLAETTSMFARAGRLDEARRYLVQLRETIAAYPQSAEIASPRSMLGGPAAHTTAEAALLLDEPVLLDDVEAEIIEVPLAPMARSWVEAGRALERGDPDRAARAMDRAHELAARVGFEGLVHGFLITLVREARRRDVGLSRAWEGPVGRTRAFATRVGAKWWLEVLAEAGV